MANVQITLVEEGSARTIPAAIDGGVVRVAPQALGWKLELQGLCKDGQCVPTTAHAGLVSEDGIDLARFAALLDRAFASDLDERIVALGPSSSERTALLRSLAAPDFTLHDLSGHPHALSAYRGRKVMLLAYASWCGCRHDLPAWQELYAELEPYGFTLISVALDRSADDARAWVEAAAATHPTLVDPEHILASLYRMTNVPTAVWIDEHGRIVRPPDVAFPNDSMREFTGVDSGPFLAALRAWVKEDRLPSDPQEARDKQIVPSADDELARVEFALAWQLHKSGRSEAAERHFVRAEQLSPMDFTIRRASLPIRGKDPMGPDFVPLYSEWLAAGRPYYRRDDG